MTRTLFHTAADLVVKIFLCTVAVVTCIFSWFSNTGGDNLDRIAYYIITMFVILCATVAAIAWCEAHHARNYSGSSI